MRSAQLLPFVTLLLLPSSLLLGQDEPKPLRRCFVVSMAMNQDPGHSEDWNQFASEIELVFSSQNEGLYEQVETRTVVGREATREQIVEAVNWAFLSAEETDLVVVYLSCHGATSRADGWGVDTMDGQTVMGRELKQAAARVRAPILFLIDTCESGGFARNHARDMDLPANCAAFCSSRARQSTTNVLNISMNEGLWGAGDWNGDGFVEVGELVRYIEARTRRLAPETDKPTESELPVIVVGDDFPNDLRLTQRSSDLVAVMFQGQWHLARRLGDEDGRISLHAFGYQDNPELDYFLFNSAERNRVFAFDGQSIPVLANRNGEMRPALLVSRERNQVTVRFPQNPRQEPITLERSEIRFPFPATRDEPADREQSEN